MLDGKLAGGRKTSLREWLGADERSPSGGILRSRFREDSLDGRLVCLPSAVRVSLARKVELHLRL
jgi:hypothetical protein